MSGKKICILGASGAVGRQMLTCLEESTLEVGELKLLASKKTAGEILKFKGEDVEVEEALSSSFSGQDIVLSAVDNNIAKVFVPQAVESGAVVIDNSSAYRLDDKVPLVVADVNIEDARNAEIGIIANPNCATIIALLAISPLHFKSNIKRMIVSTYQAASGAGIKGINELLSQQKAIAQGTEIPEPNAFCAQLAMNLIPDIGGVGDNLYTSEEMKMQNETRKILHNDNIKVNCTCVRVPIARSHSESITVEFEKEMTPKLARELLDEARGIKVIDDPTSNEVMKRYPMPLYTSDQDLVFVGRIRSDISHEDPNKALSLWCTGDQIRIGAATNAIKIASAIA